ncbi:hypothetical protein niasHT_014961 [Heterodera trifolii]|uniref:Uncharacterized protein n=1 Tax=Heterodera trifolii TaxID=157864 RepID=A0ABD2LFY3_9BILA
MSDTQNEAEEEMAKAIFISGDGWLCVFDLLEPSQLGFGIALISHRFNFYVDEHFKTRKWALKSVRIRSKTVKNGTTGLEIVNSFGNSLPMPNVQVPRKVSGFDRIEIYYIDRNVIAFLRRFLPISAACPINLLIDMISDRILELILHNIWPMIGKNILSAVFVRECFPLFPQIRPANSQQLPVVTHCHCVHRRRSARRISGR